MTFRPVASSERGFVGPAPTTAAFELTLRGNLDLDALALAFQAVRAAHPALDARVAGDGDDLRFVAPTGTGGAALVVECHDVLPDRTSMPHLDPTAALGGLHVATTRVRHRVTLAVSHALGDGTYLMTILRELCRRYTSLMEVGSVGDVVPREFPQSAQDLLPRLSTGADTGRERLAGIRWYGARPTLPATSPVLPDVTSLWFTEEETTRLTSAASGIGLNALLSGLFLCAERAGFVDEAPDLEIALGAMTLVDLRQRTSPALGPTDVTNFVGASFGAVHVTSSSDPSAVGAAVTRHLRDDVSAGRCLNVLAAAAPPVSSDPPATLSNLGAITLSLPGDLVGERLRPILTFDSALLHVPVGPRLPSPVGTVFQAVTFAGRLSVELITVGGCAPAHARAAVADRLTALVHSVTRMAPAA